MHVADEHRALLAEHRKSLGVPCEDPLRFFSRRDGVDAYVDDHGVHTGTDYTWIDLVNADGTNVRPVTPLADGIRSEPCWSRDGLRIAYRDDIYPADIFSVNPDGSDVVNVSHYANAHDISPDWGPAAP